MKAEHIELSLRFAGLVLALLILPGIFGRILRDMRNEDPACRARFETFVGCGTIGGWILVLTFVGSGPLIFLPLMAFQMAIALPAALFCLLRLTRRPALSASQKTAVRLLTVGTAITALILAAGMMIRE